MIKEAIGKLVEKQDLESQEVIQTMEEIMTGEAQPAQIAGFLVALRTKGPIQHEYHLLGLYLT